VVPADTDDLFFRWIAKGFIEKHGSFKGFWMYFTLDPSGIFHLLKHSKQIHRHQEGGDHIVAIIVEKDKEIVPSPSQTPRQLQQQQQGQQQPARLSGQQPSLSQNQPRRSSHGPGRGQDAELLQQPRLSYQNQQPQQDSPQQPQTPLPRLSQQGQQPQSRSSQNHGQDVELLQLSVQVVAVRSEAENLEENFDVQ